MSNVKLNPKLGNAFYNFPYCKVRKVINGRQEPIPQKIRDQWTNTVLTNALKDIKSFKTSSKFNTYLSKNILKVPDYSRHAFVRFIFEWATRVGVSIDTLWVSHAGYYTMKDGPSFNMTTEAVRAHPLWKKIGKFLPIVDPADNISGFVDTIRFCYRHYFNLEVILRSICAKNFKYHMPFVVVFKMVNDSVPNIGTKILSDYRRLYMDCFQSYVRIVTYAYIGRHSEKWTDSERVKLIEMVCDGKDVFEMSIHFRRTTVSISAEIANIARKCRHYISNIRDLRDKFISDNHIFINREEIDTKSLNFVTPSINNDLIKSIRNSYGSCVDVLKMASTVKICTKRIYKVHLKIDDVHIVLDEEKERSPAIIYTDALQSVSLAHDIETA